MATGNREENLKPFKPGESGNPVGRPKIPADVREAFKAHTHDALRVLVEVMDNKAEKGSARVAAASCILDRAWGKPVQSVDMKAEVKSIDVSKLTKEQMDALTDLAIESVDDERGND